MTSCSDSASFLPWDPLGEREGHVDPGRYPCSADVVALPDHVVGDDLDAHRAKVVAKPQWVVVFLPSSDRARKWTSASGHRLMTS
jgi:hypothetical protein